MKIFHKLVLGFLSVSLFVGIVGYLALSTNKRISSHLDAELHRRHFELTATEIISYAKRAEGHLMLFLTLNDDIDREKFFKRHESLLEQIQALDGLELLPNIRTIIEEVETEAERILFFGKILLKAYEEDIASEGAFNLERNKEAIRMFHGATSTVRRLGVELTKLSVEMEIKDIYKLVETTENEQRYMFVVTFIAIILSLTIGYKISKSIRISLEKLTNATVEVSKGNLDSIAEVEVKDEIGELAINFNQMTQKLKDITVSRGRMSKEVEERKEVERALSEAKKGAEAASIAKSEFLASMSHEIRTPLNVILGMADVLAETELSGEQKKYVHSLNNAGEGLLSLVNSILDLSKIEAGHVELENIEFELENLLAKLESLMGLIANEKGLKLSYHIEPDIPEMFVGDTNRLEQILFNLVSNAIKFTEKGRIDINVRKKGTEDGSMEVEFYVRDTGIGIPEDKLGTIFEKFTQADSSTTRHFGGTGLGTTISKKFVELMGGKQVREGKHLLFYCKA